jgi:hypothetical protein
MMMKDIGIDDALGVQVHVIVAEIKNLPLAGEVYRASTAIPAEIPDLVLLDEFILKGIVGDFFTS